MVYDEVGAWSGRGHPPGAVVVGYNGKKHSRAALALASATTAPQRRTLEESAYFPGTSSHITRSRTFVPSADR